MYRLKNIKTQGNSGSAKRGKFDLDQPGAE
jgi:hypothetical protein